MSSWRTCAQTLVTGAAELLFPQFCAFCGLENPGARICEFCRSLLPGNTQACERCAEPLEARLPDGVHCASCQQRPPPFRYARAPFIYSFPVDSALKSLKFNRDIHYAPVFAEFLLAELQSFPMDIDALLPVPLHRWRHTRRGFNQAIELCKPLRRASGLPMPGNVHRVRPTRTQSGLSAMERRRNLRDAFAVSGKLVCRRPLIVDDVMTTGETCRRLADVLLRHGAQEVGVLAVARSTIR